MGFDNAGAVQAFESSVGLCKSSIRGAIRISIVLLSDVLYDGQDALGAPSS